MTFKVYKIFNNINNLVYIGETKNTLARRFTQHCRKDSSCTKLRRAIQKYGRCCFFIELLQEFDSKKLASEFEQKSIAKLNTISHGYNIWSGDSSAYSSIKGKTKSKISSFKGKKHTAESKALMR